MTQEHDTEAKATNMEVGDNIATNDEVVPNELVPIDDAIIGDEAAPDENIAPTEAASTTPVDTLILSETGDIVWNDVIIARLLSGQPLLEPKFELIGPELNREETAVLVRERLDSWMVEMLRTDLAPLFRLRRAIDFIGPVKEAATEEAAVATEAAERPQTVAEEATENATACEQELATTQENIGDAAEGDLQTAAIETGEEENQTPQTQAPKPAYKKPVKPAPEALSETAKEIAQMVFDAGGILERGPIDTKIAALSQDCRREIRATGIKFGRSAIYLPLLLKPKAVRLNIILANFANGNDGSTAPLFPPTGVTSFATEEDRPQSQYMLCGFQKLGTRAIRLDIIDRVIDALYDTAKEAKGGFVLPNAVVSLLGVSNDAAEAVVTELGWESLTDEEGNKKWRLKRQKPVYKRPEPTTTENRPKRENTFKPGPRPAQTQGFNKKRKDKPDQSNRTRDFSARPERSNSRNNEDSPFAILAQLKADLLSKKD